MQEIKLKVSNLYCGDCVSDLQNGLGEMDEIASVAIDSPDLGDILQQPSTPGYPPVQ